MFKNLEHRRRIAVLALPAILALGLFAWLTRPVKIGVVISTRTFVGFEENLAVRHYRLRAPRAGLRAIEYLIRNPSLERHAIAAAYRDLEDRGVAVIIGAASSIEGIVMAEEAARSGIPTIGINAAVHYLDGKKDNFYRISLSTHLQGKYLAKYVAALGAGRVVVVMDEINRTYAETLGVSFERHFPGHCLLTSFAGAGATGDAVLAFQPQCLVLILRTPAMLELLNRVRPSLPGMPVVTAAWSFDNLACYASPATRGVRTVTLHDSVSTRYRDEIARFDEHHRSAAAFGAVSVFAVMDIVTAALREAGTGRASLARYFSAPRVYDGAYDRIFIDEYGDAFPRLLYLREITDEGIVTRGTIPVGEFPDETVQK